MRELPSHTIRVDEGNVAQFVEFLPTQDEKIAKYVIKRGAAFDAAKVVVEADALALREVMRSAERCRGSCCGTMTPTSTWPML